MISILLQERTVSDHINNQVDLVNWAKSRKIIPKNIQNKPKLEDGEYAIPMINKNKIKAINPRTGRLKNKKIVSYLKTNIKPEDRTLKNLPRDSKKKGKVRFQDWLQLKNTSVSNHSVGQGANGHWYGWSHRAIGEFYPGKEIKHGIIGNKFEYGKAIDQKYNQLENTKGRIEAKKYIKSLANFKPYKIKTDEEAMNHAIRFARDVS